MADANYVSAVIWEDSSPVMMGRITNYSASNITQASCSAITYEVTDTTAPDTIAASGTLTISSVIYDTLQTDSIWTLDSTGYNFKWIAPASLFPLGKRTYIAEVIIDVTSGDDLIAPFKITTREIFGG